MIEITVGGVFGLILLGLCIYAILRVAQSNAAVIWKVVWIVLILVLPLLGFLLWLILGPTKPAEPMHR